MSQLVAGSEEMSQKTDQTRVTGRRALLKMYRQTKMTDLNFDCLERILRLLSFNDLLQLGRTCVALRQAACSVFSPMFRNHEVLIDCDEFPVCKVISCSVSKYHRIAVGINIETFLKVFGVAITKMTILNMQTIMKYYSFGKFHTKRTDEMTAYLIGKYCGDNLLELKFKNCGVQAATNVPPFPKVTTVTFDTCVLGAVFANIAYLFPNMRKLDLIDCNVAHARNSIEEHFPQIDSWSLLVSFGSNSRINFNTDDVKTVINKNLGMKNLSMCFWNEVAYDGKMLKYASVKLQQLKSLTLWHFRYTDFCSEGHIHFGTVRKLTLANHYHCMGRLDRNLGTLTFFDLQKFCMIGEFDSECTTFLARHKTIKKVYIVPNGNHDWYPTDDDVERVVSVLPNIEKLVLDGKRLTANGLLKLVSQKSISRRKMLSHVTVLGCTFPAPIRRILQLECSKQGWKVYITNDIKLYMQRKPY